MNSVLTAHPVAKLKNEMHEQGKRHSLDLKYISYIIDAQVDEAIELVKTELLPNLCKYVESSNSC